METRMIWANLAVSDLDKTTKFYTDLGFKPNGTNVSSELVSFTFGNDNFIINFFTVERLKAGTKMEVADLTHGNEVIFSLSADSREEVDQWTQIVKDAGGVIFSGPEDFQKGYTFGFSDPDGHKFNFLYWPGM
ncbi:VOC family protein [Pedobacter frigiditerrae]|uniref:VOC family protein n=1 Tax=Pedobacter frigiditerrae TaxID=2530452 RepID=UPI002931D6E2|nr:VOC family protein [Pedobacter frigiditerrae]